MNFEPRTIVIFSHRHMGDALGSFPAIAAMRARWPDARIVGVASPLALNLLEGSGLADRLIAQQRNWRANLRTLADIRREKPDVAVCFSSSFRVVMMAGLSGARVRAGFAPTKHTFTLNLKIPWDGLQSTRLDLQMARALGAPTVADNTVGLLNITPTESSHGAAWLQQRGADSSKPLVGINLGASVERRRWSVANFAKVCDELSNEAQFIVFGGPGDKTLVDELRALTQAPLTIAAGELTPRETAAIMQSCATVISCDTGPMHLAIAVETPVVALFGLVPSSLRVPPGLGHIALEHNAVCQQLPLAKCATRAQCACLASITPAEVVAATRAQLSKRRS